MTAAPSLAFPGSRVVAGWWRQLAPLRPRALWVAHLFFHRVEALARVARPERLDSFRRAILKALAAAPAKTVPGLDARLHLGPQVLRQVLERLHADGLAEAGAGGGWASTALGRQALDRGEYPRAGYERRVFHFVENRRGPPQFLNLNPALPSPFPAPEGWRFDAGLLEACPRRPDEWKRRHGFPADVERVLRGGAETGQVNNAVPEWRRVILDQPEHLPAALVLAPGADGGGERLLGFAVRPEGWALQAPEAAFSLGAGWQETFPDLAQEAGLGAWRQAWREWCQPRGVPAAEVEACALERRDHLLRVLAPKKLVDRLRSARSDAIKGEAWLLAGGENVRPAALVEVQEAAPAKA
jgi:hypothetical protein